MKRAPKSENWLFLFSVTSALGFLAAYTSASHEDGIKDVIAVATIASVFGTFCSVSFVATHQVPIFWRSRLKELVVGIPLCCLASVSGWLCGVYSGDSKIMSAQIKQFDGCMKERQQIFGQTVSGIEKLQAKLVDCNREQKHELFLIELSSRECRLKRKDCIALSSEVYNRCQKVAEALRDYAATVDRAFQTFKLALVDCKVENL